jgi:ABC-2 type transport system permease protein
VIRGYFSANTHPLLAPLVPQIRDLLREYAIAGEGKARVEVVDPLEDPELEREAGEQYGIRPVAFQTESKYQAGVVNSYFDILVLYGGEHEKLDFRDLIEVKAGGEAELAVRLRNPEYDITRAVKKVLYGYQGGGDLFQGLVEPVTFHGYISEPSRLPEPLPALRADLEAVLTELAEASGGKLTFDIRDPDAGDGALAREIEERFGFQPLVLGLLDPNAFYFYMVLESDGRAAPVPLPESLDKLGLRRAIEAGIKRFTPGVLKTVALYTPPAMGGFMPGQTRYAELTDSLRQNATLRETDLASGQVPEDADLLLVVGPEDLDEKQVFAIDQFLMQGGAVVIAASPYHVDLGGQAIAARPQATGLEDWLAHLGLELEETLVLDPRNTPFPIPVQRQIGGFVVEEIQTLAYPYFPDIRSEGMDQETGILSGLGQITLNWASPLKLDAEKNRDRLVVELLSSSAASWTDPSAEIQPDFQAHPDSGFPVGEERGARLLAAAVEGRFGSLFAGKPSPLLGGPPGEAAEGAAAGEGEQAGEADEARPVISGVVESSPASAKLILVGSASFLTDTAISLATEATRTVYTKPVELVQNAVDWALEDRGLLPLRGRGQYSRLLEPLEREEQVFWEYLNYALALAGLMLVYWLHRRSRLARQHRYAALLSAGRT